MKGFDINSMATDKDLEKEGVWIELSGEARIKIARLNNPRYKELFTAKTKPHRQAIRNNVLSEKVADDIMIEVMAATILLDWENFFEGEKPLEYNLVNARRVLRELPDFRRMVYEMAGEADNFKQVEVEEAVGN